MSELPMGWAQTTIGKVCIYIQRGKSPKYIGNSDLPVINQKCVRWWGIDERYLKFIDPAQFSSWTEERFLIIGDVLWNSTGTGTIGRAALFNGLNTANQAVVDSHVTVLRPSAAVCGAFLHRFVQSPTIQNAIADMQSGTTNQVELNRTEIIETAFALPPVAEQKRIVAKLDALSAKSARARTELARIGTLASRYKQAVLSKAYHGELIAHGQSGEAVRTRSVKGLSEVCESITDGDHQAPPKSVSGVPFITISAMNDGSIDVSRATRFVPQSYYNELQDSRKPRLGDILYSVTGSYGIPALVKSDQAFVFQRHIAILRPDKTIVSGKYIEYILASPEVKAQADSLATGTAQKTVPLKGLRNFKVPVPSMREQHEVVDHIDSAFAHIDRLTAQAKRALALLGRLEEAILGKAFRGELVPQNESDEPADRLLELIGAERAAAKKEPKPTRRKTPMLTASNFLKDKLQKKWPEDGVSFQDLRAEFSGSYDDLRDAIFSLLSDEKPMLQQFFDNKRSLMILRKSGR